MQHFIVRFTLTQAHYTTNQPCSMHTVFDTHIWDQQSVFSICVCACVRARARVCVFCSCQCLNIVIFLVKGLGKYGVLFHNSLIIVIPTLLASACTGDLHKVQTFYHQIKSICVCLRVCLLLPFDYPVFCGTAGSHVWRLGWSHVYILLPRVLLHGVGLPQLTPHALQSLHCVALRWSWQCFPNSCCVVFLLRFVLMYSIVLCSYYNSALTTTVVGAIKVGMLHIIICWLPIG